MLRRKRFTTTLMENWIKRKRLAPLGALCVLCAVPAAAATINLSTTTGNTTGYTITSDTNCTSGSPPLCTGGTSEGTTVHAVTDVGALSWVPNDTISDSITSNSIWIAPQAVQGSPSDPSGNGTTIYDVTFSLPTGATGITLYINLTGDDYVTAVLNGSTNVFTPTAGDTTNGMWTTTSGLQTITTGFLTGTTNTLQFTVPNNSSDGTGRNCCGPTGLNVDADVVYTTSSTPEPGTLALIGTGLLGLGVSFRRRKRQ
jgi:hypothetical protein